MKIRYCITLLLLVSCVLIGYSQSAEAETPVTVKIELGSVIERALETNLDMRVGSYDLKKSSISKFASWNVLVPTITAGGTLSRKNATIDATPAIPTPEEKNQWSLNRDVTIRTPLASQLASNVLSLIIPYKDYDAGKITYEKLVATTVKNVEISYVDFFVAYQILNYRQEKLQADQEKEEEARKSFESGLKDEYSYLQTQLATLNAQKTVAEQENIYRQHSEKLAILLDYPIDTEFEFIEELGDYDILEASEGVDKFLTQTSTDNNYDLRKLYIQQDINKLNRTKTMFGFIPTVSLSWSTSYMFQESPLDDKSWVGDYWGKDTGSLSLTLSVPISQYHPWSSTFVNVRRLNQDIKKNELNIVLTKKNQDQALLSAQRTLDVAIQSLRVQKEAIRIAERNADLAGEAYEGGLMNYSDYQDAQDAYYKARIDELTYQKLAYESLLNIQLIVGKDLFN